MSNIFLLPWRSLLALSLQTLLIVQLLAVPIAGKQHGDWVEICTSDGVIKQQLDSAGEPVDPVPSGHGHENCTLCLPVHAGMSGPLPRLISASPTSYSLFRPSVVADAIPILIPIGPPIGARGPPQLS